jgi:hypothetical protein
LVASGELGVAGKVDGHLAVGLLEPAELAGSGLGLGPGGRLALRRQGGLVVKEARTTCSKAAA